ncbi:9859_t:CDS:1, partial [Gigaspora margarita]
IRECKKRRILAKILDDSKNKNLIEKTKQKTKTQESKIARNQEINITILESINYNANKKKVQKINSKLKKDINNITEARKETRCTKTSMDYHRYPKT